jgi:hypothetical protein
MADETVKETKAPEMTEEEIVGQLPDMQLAQLRFELGCSDSVCTNKAELKQQLVDAVTKKDKDAVCFDAVVCGGCVVCGGGVRVRCLKNAAACIMHY